METFQKDIKLSTTQALALTSIDSKRWNNILQKRQYSEAPDMNQGVTRYFYVDDIVALFIIDHFSRCGQTLAVSGRTASAVRRKMKKHSDNIEFLWVVETLDRKFISVSAHDPGPHCYTHRIPVADLRRKIALLATAIMEREAA